MAIIAFNPQQLALFEALNRNQVRFIIVGLSSAILQGAPLSTQDVDLWIDDLTSSKFQAAVKEAGGFYIPPGVAGMNPPMLGPEKFRLFDLVVNMHGLEDFEHEFSGCIELELDGIPVKILPLERIIVSKRATNREKDRAMLPVLENVLEAKAKFKSI